MNKRAIAILGGIFILIVATLGFLIYTKTKKTTPVEETVVETPVVEETPATEVPPAEPTSQAVRLTDDAVVSPVLFYQGNGISYFNSNGQLFQTDLQVSDGSALLSNKRELSIANKTGINRILWPQAGNGFIAETGSASKPWYNFYDSVKASYVELPEQMYSVDWMPSGDKIMYVWVDVNGKASLNISNPDGTGFQTVTNFWESDNIIKVSPDGRNVLFYRNQTIDNSKNTIEMVSSDGKTFTTVVKDGYNTGVLWSPDSRKFLFTKRDSNGKFGLWVADIATGEVRDLNVSTSVNKVVWTKDSSAVFAGVPTTNSSSQSLTQDSIFKISISDSQQTEIAPGIPVDVENLFLSSDEGILFFRNAQDNSLYYIPAI